MEEELNQIQAIFQSGKHKAAIIKLEALTKTLAADDKIYNAYRLLGDYLDYMGQHTEAVEAWTNGLKVLEGSAESVDELSEWKRVHWMKISLKAARVLCRQGKTNKIDHHFILKKKTLLFLLSGLDGSGVSHKYNGDCYSAPKFPKNEEKTWKNERFQMAIKFYQTVIEKILIDDIERKRELRIELAHALFNAENYDEAVKIYEDAFNVSISLLHSFHILNTDAFYFFL